jgi:hypothetical protein
MNWVRKLIGNVEQIRGMDGSGIKANVLERILAFLNLSDMSRAQR